MPDVVEHGVEHGVEHVVGHAFRTATVEDVGALTDLERDANLVALHHVYDPTLHPFPLDDVRSRWERLLTEEAVVVEVLDGVDGTRGLQALLARDHERVVHLAVHPDRWGHGLAGAALDRAESAIRAGGATPRLWCLVENWRARGLYEHRGWSPTGRERPSEFAPYPVLVEYTLRRGPG